jgi:hypothetical protein
MREHVESQLNNLRQEFELGQTRLRDLEAQHTRLRETLLRISGAIQILEEVLAAATMNGPPTERNTTTGGCGDPSAALHGGGVVAGRPGSV